MFSIVILNLVILSTNLVVSSPYSVIKSSAPPASGAMSLTVLNPEYRGLVEAVSIPAELHSRPDGKPYASFGSTVPIHCCTEEQKRELSNTTHHYCDIFTEQLLAPLGELAYVRLDENTAEKVFINRSKRILLISSDGALAQWRAASSFESTNSYMAGAPVVDKDLAIVSLVTAKRGNHYAVSAFEGEGGYFDTPVPWKVVDPPEGTMVYGDRYFTTREELRAYVEALPPALVDAENPPTPVLQKAANPRVVLVAANGRQISHHYLYNVIATGVEYL